MSQQRKSRDIARDHHLQPKTTPQPQQPNLGAALQCSGAPDAGTRNSAILTLQRTVGNQAVQRVLQRQSAPTATVIQRAGLNNPDWPEVVDAKYISSTNGGVVIFTFQSGEKLVLKSSPYAHKEIFANRLAREVGLSAPDMRLVEGEELKTVFPHLEGPLGEGFAIAGAITLMEYVEGVTLGGAKSNKSSKKIGKSTAKSLSSSLGQWLAFDLMVGEGDRFRGLNKEDKDVNINEGNLMFDPTNKNSSFSGIDQSSMMLGAQPINPDLHQRIMGGDMGLGARMVTPMLTSLGVKSKKPDKYRAKVLEGAQEQFARMSQLSPERVQILAQGLELPDGDAEQVVENVMQLRG